MSFYLDISYIEFILIGLFGLIYLLYILLIYQKSKILKTKPRYLFLKPTIRILYFSLIILSLLGPVFGIEKQEVKVVGKDVFILVDISQSMNGLDIQPSRIEKIKFELKSIIESLKDCRVGLIVFTTESAMQCPLTFDHRIITDIFLKTLNTNLMYSGGTNFTNALKMASDKFSKDESVTENTGKIVILISDGENFGDDLSSTVKDVNKAGIKVFTVGVGTRQGSKIPNREGYKKDADGEEIISKLDVEDLKYIAEKTSGRYYEINEYRNEIPQLIAQVQGIKGNLKDTREFDTKANKYVYFLWIALFLVVLDILITARVIKL